MSETRGVVPAADSCLAPWDEASGVPQGGVYARVGYFLAVIEALGVDAEQDFNAMSGPLGDSWRRYPSRQPEGNGCVAQVVG